MKRSEIELSVTHKSNKKEFQTMKKKIVIALVTIILLILASNIVIHTHLNKSLFQFFFSNNENQESIVKKILTQGNQKIEIDNYIISLEESLCEKNTQLGYLVFSICDKNGNKVESNINDYNKTINHLEKTDDLYLNMKHRGLLISMQNMQIINYLFMHHLTLAQMIQKI